MQSILWSTFTKIKSRDCNSSGEEFKHLNSLKHRKWQLFPHWFLKTDYQFETTKKLNQDIREKPNKIEMKVNIVWYWQLRLARGIICRKIFMRKKQTILPSNYFYSWRIKIFHRMKTKSLYKISLPNKKDNKSYNLANAFLSLPKL